MSVSAQKPAGKRHRPGKAPNSSFCPRLHSAKDGGVELPENVQGKAAGKIVDKLIRAGLLEEVGASGSLPVWRRDDDNGAIALRITSAGLAAIAAADEVMVTPEENGGRPSSTGEIARSALW